MESNLGTIFLRIRAALLWVLFFLIVLAAALHEDERSRPNDQHPAVYVTAQDEGKT